MPINALSQDEIKHLILDQMNRFGYEGLKHFTMHYELDCRHRADIALDAELGFHKHDIISENLDEFYETAVKHHYRDSKGAVLNGDRNAFPQIAGDQAAATHALCDQMHAMARNEAIAQKATGHSGL